MQRGVTHADPGTAVIEFIGSDTAITVPGSPSEVVEALMDALGYGAPHPLGYPANGAITNYKR